MKKHNKQDCIPKTTNKYFYALSDKDMLHKLKFYDMLYMKFFNLKNQISMLKSNHKMVFRDKEISCLLIQAQTLYDFLEKELKKLQEIYMTTNYRNFINQTQTFKSMLENWDNTLQKLDFLLLKLNQNKTTNKQQKQR